MSGQIPKYGEHFRRVSVPRDFIKDLAHTEYVSKRYPLWSVRGNGNSELWRIFKGFDEIAGPFSTMTEAMNRLTRALWELYAPESEPPPNAIWGKKNRY